MEELEKTFIEEYCGGIWKGRKLKGLVPGGSSFPILAENEAYETNLSFESCAQAGTSLGSGGFYVMDEATCMVGVLADTTKFYAHESCGQCTPCREGTGWIDKILQRVLVEGGEQADYDLLNEISDNMAGKTICVLSDAIAMPVVSFLKKFPEDFKRHLRGQGGSSRIRVI